MHPEFASYKDGALIKKNAFVLKNMLKKNNIQVDKFGARQHYLRWQVPDTWQHYEDAGIEYDTTLSYADHIGFRCGICYEYPVFNFKTREQLKLKEYPLIVMDGSGIDYMGLSYEEMEKRTIRLKHSCEKYNGNFVLLWHNDMFIDTKLNVLYRKISCIFY